MFKITDYDLIKNFIFKRIEKQNYRSIKSFQHNRQLNIKYCSFLLSQILNLNGLNSNGCIYPAGDISERSKNKTSKNKYNDFIINSSKGEIYHPFATLLDKLQEEYDNKNTTIQTLSKNLFPDLKRMGLITINEVSIKKFDKNYKLNKVNVTKNGELFVNSDSNYQKQLWAEACNKAYPELLANLRKIMTYYFLDDKNNKSKTIPDEEDFIFLYTYILSSYENNLDELIDLTKKYEKLSTINKHKLNLEIKNKIDQINKDAKNKIQKRDDHNWKNKSKQLWSMMDSDDILLLDIELKDKGCTYSLKRSIKVFYKYMHENNILSRKRGYEFHHIVPISEGKHNFSLNSRVDDWKNICYTDKHSQFKGDDKNEKHYEINFNNNKLIFKSILDDDKILDLELNPESYIMLEKNQKKVIEYNRYLIDLLKRE